MTRTDPSSGARPAETTPDEVAELVTSLFHTPADRMTACRGWTAHELVAHLAAGAAEEAAIIEAHLSGGPDRATRGFEERELPFRALPDPALRDRLVEEAARLGTAIERLGAEGAEAQVSFTGRPMTAAGYAMHSRSECALHRWDLVGEDDVGRVMLARPELTEHALGVLTSMVSLSESPAGRLGRESGLPEARIVIRSVPSDDVVVVVRDQVVTLTLSPIDESPPAVELDAATRLLLLWGRRQPGAPVDLHAGDAERRVLETLFGL